MSLFYTFFAYTIMQWNTFEGLYKQTMNIGHFIFSTEHGIINLNNVYQLKSNLTLLIQARIRKDGQMHQIYKHYSTMSETIVKNYTFRNLC